MSSCRVVSGLFACVLLLGAGSPGAMAGGEPPERGTSPRRIAPPTRIPDPIVASSPPGTAVQVATVPRTVRRAVVADAAQRFKVPESAVVLARVEQVTWPDGALGCPEPGRQYAQVLVSGFRIRIHTGSETLEYHGSVRGRVMFCPASRIRPPSAADPRM